MFLDYIEFFKIKAKTPAKRDRTVYWNTFCLQKRFKYLSIRKKWLAGRNDSGRIVFWTRKSLLNRVRQININYDIRKTYLCFISNFQFIPFKNKLVSLVHFANGMITYYLTTDYQTLFIYYLWVKKKRARYIFGKWGIFRPFWARLIQIPKLTIISYIKLNLRKKAQYCLSAGTKSKLWSFDRWNKTAVVVLPSKEKKTVSMFTVVLFGQVALSTNRKYFNTKSGYWRSFGIKSITRGVAMNPVDHPHGGRTKAIRYQRTPWGKTTKIK